MITKENRSVIILAGINFLLAAVSFLKDLLLAAYIGTSYQADAFILAFFIPDTIGSNLLAASLNVVCIPYFSHAYFNEKYTSYKRKVRNLAVMSLLTTSMIILIMYFFRAEIIRFSSDGMNASAGSLCVGLFVLILPYILFYPLYAIGSAVLQIERKFIIPALGPVIFNLAFLLGVSVSILGKWKPEKGLSVISVSIAAGAASMAVLIWSVLLLRKRKTITDMKRMNKTETGSNFKSNFVYYILILCTLQTIIVFERMIGAHYGTGTVSGTSYAYRLSQFPMWVFVAAVNVVLLPSMSKAINQANWTGLTQSLYKALKAVLLVSLPISVLLFFLRYPTLEFLFMHGSFDKTSVKITAGILAGYSVTIAMQSISLVLLRYYLAVGKMLKPLLIFMTSASVNILCDFAFTSRIGYSGLGWGSAVGWSVNILLMFLLVKQEFGLRYGHKFKKLLLICISAFAAAFPLMIAVYVYNRFKPFTTIGLFIFLAISCTAFVGLYLTGVKVCKVMDDDI